MLKSENWPTTKHELMSKYLKIILTLYKIDKFWPTVRVLDIVHLLIYWKDLQIVYFRCLDVQSM